MQLLGIASLLIATKFEDVYQPTTEDLKKHALPYNIDPKEVKELEKQILQILDFDVQYPSTLRFLEIFCNVVKATNTHRVYGQFILEIALLERRMIQEYKASLIAYATLFLVSNRIRNLPF